MQVNTNYRTEQSYGTSAAQKTRENTRTGDEYLQELIAKYPRANISARDVANIKSYAMGRSGELNDVAISPEALEKFANDPEAAAKMESLLQQFLDQEQHDKNYAAANGMTLTGRGMVVDKNGEARFWAMGVTSRGEGSNSMFDRLSRQTEERKKVAEKEAEKRAEKKAEEKRAKERQEYEKMLEESVYKTHFATGRSSDELMRNLTTEPAGGNIFDANA